MAVSYRFCNQVNSEFKSRFIGAAIVAYRPDLALLAEVVNATASQADRIFIIANDGAPWSCPLPANATLEAQGKNIGLGAAYNLASKWAQNIEATHLLL